MCHQWFRSRDMDVPKKIIRSHYEYVKDCSRILLVSLGQSQQKSTTFTKSKWKQVISTINLADMHCGGLSMSNMVPSLSIPSNYKVQRVNNHKVPFGFANGPLSLTLKIGWTWIEPLALAAPRKTYWDGCEVLKWSKLVKLRQGVADIAAKHFCFSIFFLEDLLAPTAKVVRVKDSLCIPRFDYDDYGLHTMQQSDEHQSCLLSVRWGTLESLRAAALRIVLALVAITRPGHLQVPMSIPTCI